jgi:hypothetical protein
MTGARHTAKQDDEITRLARLLGVGRATKWR